MNNVLTDAAMATVSELWVQIGDLEEHNALSPANARHYWQNVANMCTAFSEQHKAAEMHDESSAFDWLSEVALVRASIAVGCIDAPRIQLITSIGKALQ